MQIKRVIRLAPYGPGRGPIFRVVALKDGPFAEYQLWVDGDAMPLFINTTRPGDFRRSSGTAPFSPRAICEILSWWTQVPGEVEDDFFDDYDEEQLAFAGEHADALASEVEAWCNEWNVEF